MSRTNNTHGGAVLAASLAMATPTFAQERPRESWTVEEIVVTGQRAPAYTAIEAATATKTPTPIQEVPQSIQVLSRTLLEEQDRRGLFDALENVSGVVPIRIEELVLEQPIVRGFPSEVYVDGLPTFGLTSAISPGTLIGIERIEVAKGPTATLYGGGAGAPLGGLINLVSRTPGPAASYGLGGRAGSFDTLSAFADLSQPVGRGVAARLAGEIEERGTQVDGVDIQTTQLTPSLAADFGLDTRLTLVGHYSRVEQLEYAGFPAALIGVPGVDSETFSGALDAPETTVENRLLTATLAHGFGTHLEGTITARRYENRFREYASFPFSTFFPPDGARYPLIKGYLPTDVDQTTIDANLLWRTRTGALSHQVLFGATWDDTDYDAAAGFDFTPIGVLDYRAPATRPSFGMVPALTRTQTDRYETAAVYVQDQVDVGERLHLLAGLRYTRLDFERRESGYDRSYERLTPRVGATYELGAELALFAGYAEGFRAPTGFFGADAPVPETSKAWEGGLKLADRTRGLSGTLAIYEITRRNVPVADPAVPFNTVQTGEQRSRGAELDLVWEPAPAFSLLATYAYTDAEVTKDTTIPAGDRLARVPEHSGRIAARYRFRDGRLQGLELGAGATAVSERELTLPNSHSVDGRWAIDAQAAYDFGPATLSLSIVNLSDEGGFDPYRYLNQAVAIPVQPRSVFLTLSTRFGDAR